MRYFSEKERTDKEGWIKNYSGFIRNIYYHSRTVHDDYDEQLAPLINEETVLLDAGCGEKGIMNKYKGKTKRAVGIDASLEAMEKNTSLDDYVQVHLENEKLPFEDETFDVVICQWVIEHLENPKLVYKEFDRVLKKNGHMILVTNSIYNPMMLISKILPLKLRDSMKEKIFPDEIDEDTFPTYYNCNSKRAFEKALTELGYTRVFSGYSNDISIFLFSKILFMLVVLFDKVTDIKGLKCFKMHIVAHYKK